MKMTYKRELKPVKLPKPSEVLSLAAEIVTKGIRGEGSYVVDGAFACHAIGEAAYKIVGKSGTETETCAAVEAAMEFFLLLRPLQRTTEYNSWFGSPYEVSNQRNRQTALLLAAQIAKEHNK